MSELRYLGLAAVKREGRRASHWDPEVEAEIQALLLEGPYWTDKEWKRLCELVDMKNALRKRFMKGKK